MAFRFSLYYYSGYAETERKFETVLTIDTRASNIKDNFIDSLSDDEDDEERGVDYLSFGLKTK